MEGVGDRSFRRAMAFIGGFDEAVRDFIRVPTNGHVKSLAKVYQANELFPIPLAAQIMGSDPLLMAEMAQELMRAGAPRIDINCGCPSNTVTGRGAGSSLLRDPESLHVIAKAVVSSVNIPVTLKMRSGFDDITLFEENLLAAESSGVRYITLHPRTKADGYGPPARWDLIARAKKLLKIPLIGNGDILTVEDALNILQQTNCDALMIGRGSIRNPFVFRQIKAHFAKEEYTPKKEDLLQFLQVFLSEMQETPMKTKVNKLKQLLGFILKESPHRQKILSSSHQNPETLLHESQEIL
ncbi:MAG TPA: tRNA-dihydrouridine synthase family protein [Chlamydiales bacterium]|nr:tRNA-dihydrouridine synthase family protein [Chlamydiales bacterium]